MKTARSAEQVALWMFVTLLMLMGWGCAPEEESGGAVPVFNFPSDDEGDEGDEGEESGESSNQEGGEGQDTPKEPVDPALESLIPEKCMGPAGEIAVVATHPEGVASVVFFKGEEEVLALTTEDGSNFSGTLDLTDAKEGALSYVVKVTSNTGREITVNVDWAVDLTTPVLKWDTPLGGDIVSGMAVLTGKATDTGGCGIAKIESFLDDVLIAETVPPEPEEEEITEGEGEEAVEEPEPVYGATTPELNFFHEKDTSNDGTFLGTLKVRATDFGGNEVEDTRVVYVVKPLDMLYAGETKIPGNVTAMTRVLLDDDSLMDVLVATNSSVIGAQSLGKGNFGKWLDIDLEPAEQLLTGDLDDDGDMDIITYKKDISGGKFRVLLREEPGNYTLSQEQVVESEKVVNELRLTEMTGDGIPDVVMVTGSGSQSIGVWSGLPGGGQFKPTVKWAGGIENIVDIEMGDFNGDLNQDAVVVSSDTNKVSVFLGDGAGGFYAANDTILEESAVSIVPGFFDEDDKLDLVVALSGAQNAKLQFLKGQGNGYFAVSFDMSYGGPPKEVDVADFDSDGLLDVVATMGDRTAAFFYGRDNLKNGYRYVIGPDADFLQVGQFTGGDGWNGLGIAATKKLGGLGGTAIVAIGGDGEGFFNAAPVLWNRYKCPGKNYTNCSIFDYESLVVGQFDLNSGLDVAAVSEAYTDFNLDPIEGVYQYDISLFLSEDGFLPASYPNVELPITGYFAFEKWSQKGAILSIETGDFNGDGDADLAVANETGYVKPPGQEGWTVTPANVDILLQQNGGFDPQGVLGTWAGRDAAAFPPDSEAQKQGKLKAITVADLDSDDLDDIVGVTPYVKDTTNLVEDVPSHLTVWFPSVGSMLFLPALASAVDAAAIADPGTVDVVVGDIDLDGRIDMMSVNPAVNNVAVHYGEGARAFVDGRLFSAVSPGVKVTTLGQLNPDEDAYPDLVSVGSSEVFITYGREHVQGEDDPFEPPVTLDYVGSQPMSVTTTDLNLDGLEDILVLDESASAAYLYAGMGQRTFAEIPLMIQVSGGAQQLKLGDLDEDGCQDVVVLSKSGITILRNQSCDNGALPEPAPGEEGGESDSEAEGGESAEEAGESTEEGEVTEDGDES